MPDKKMACELMTIVVDGGILGLAEVSSTRASSGGIDFRLVAVDAQPSVLSPFLTLFTRVNWDG